MTIEDKLKVVFIVLSLFITVLYIIQSSKLEKEKDRAKQAEERLSKSIEQNREEKADDAGDARIYGIRGWFDSISSETLNALIEVRSDCESRRVEGKCKTCKYYHSINCYEHRATEEIESRGLLK